MTLSDGLLGRVMALFNARRDKLTHGYIAVHQKPLALNIQRSVEQFDQQIELFQTGHARKIFGYIGPDAFHDIAKRNFQLAMTWRDCVRVIRVVLVLHRHYPWQRVKLPALGVFCKCELILFFCQQEKHKKILRL